MTSSLHVYVAAVIAAGTLTLVANLPRGYDNPALAATCAAAMLAVSLFKLRMPLFRGEATMSMAYVLDFLALVTMGADVAMVIAIAGVLVQCLVGVRRRPRWYRTAFSMATVVLAVQTAGWVWSATGGTIADPDLVRTLLPLSVAGLFYFAVNSGLVGGVIALSSQGALVRDVSRECLRTAPAFVVAGASVAVIHILMTPAAAVMPATAIPIVASHLLYAAWFRRVAERERPSPVSL